MNYEKIKNMPTSRDGKMVYGVVSAIMARLMVKSGIETYATNHDGAFIAFLMASVLAYTCVLAMVRYNTGRPLFEPLGKR